MATSEDRMIQIVEFDTNEEGVKTIFHTSALKDILSKKGCPEKILVLAIFGQKRTGKSLLINLLACLLQHLQKTETTEGWLEQKICVEGVNWKRGENSVTKGIWIWDDLFLLKKDKQEFGVILMDCQGAYDPAEEHYKVMDTLTTVFSLELSNIHVINVMKQVTANDFEHLMVAIQHVQRQQRKIELYDYLILLFRDWEATDEYGPQEGVFSHLKRNLTVDETIVKDAFKERLSYKLPMPGESIRKGSSEQFHMINYLAKREGNPEFFKWCGKFGSMLFEVLAGEKVKLVDRGYFLNAVQMLQKKYADGTNNPRFYSPFQMLEIGELRGIVNEILKGIECLDISVDQVADQSQLEAQFFTYLENEHNKFDARLAKAGIDEQKYKDQIMKGKGEIAEKITDLKHVNVKHFHEYKETEKQKFQMKVIKVFGIAAGTAAILTSFGATGIATIFCSVASAFAAQRVYR